MATKIKNGAKVILSTTETAYVLDSGRNVPEVIFITLVSGDVQATTVPGADLTTPVLDSTYATWSTAGDKFPISLYGNATLRMKCSSSGVVNITW